MGQADVALAGGGLLTLTALKWQLAHFEIEDAALAAQIGTGWICTLHAALPDADLDLEQLDSSFWCSSAVGARPVELEKSMEPAAGPQWRKRSNRYWPHVGSVAVPFIGQAYIAGGDIYLFRLVSGPVVAHWVDRFEQDVEDHYSAEA